MREEGWKTVARELAASLGLQQLRPTLEASWTRALLSINRRTCQANSWANESLQRLGLFMGVVNTPSKATSKLTGHNPLWYEDWVCPPVHCSHSPVISFHAHYTNFLPKPTPVPLCKDVKTLWFLPLYYSRDSKCLADWGMYFFADKNVFA